MNESHILDDMKNNPVLVADAFRSRSTLFSMPVRSNGATNISCDARGRLERFIVFVGCSQSGWVSFYS
jgi:hypothetical protein